MMLVRQKKINSSNGIEIALGQEKKRKCFEHAPHIKLFKQFDHTNTAVYSKGVAVNSRIQNTE